MTREELAQLSKAELSALARERGLPGRSRMVKAELVDALADAPPGDEVTAANELLDALGDLADLGDEVEIEFREIGSDRPLPRRSLRESRERRRALNERLASYFDPERRCSWRSVEGHPCGLPALTGGMGCPLHSDIDLVDLALPLGGHLGFDTWPSLLRHLWLTSYEIDPIGFDPVIAEMTWHLLNFLYFDYFRVEVEGIEHVPMEGGAMMVANHGGAALPYDGMMLAISVANEASRPRRVRPTATELFNIVPWLSQWFRKSGGVYASREDVEFVLRRGHLVGVFPEGEKGFMKPVWEAYEVQRFGRGGFISIAERAGVPVVPVAIVGSEEVHPAVTVSKRLARIVKMVMPEQRVDNVAVFLNPIPLPVRWHIRFHPPVMPESPGTDPDPLAMLERADLVRQTIQGSLADMLAHRRGPFT
jgi:1-acyl-sn-glycerol-3-phosphate acyltransferase